MTAMLIERERNDALLAWYRAERRSFPWRGENDPYKILVSEVMLQQTQASRVIPFYERFVASFATASDLASADLKDVLALWTGLGYNSRALRLRETARIVARDGWPTTITGLIELPGIGPYTAAAVASFAFGQRVPTVDTNLRRVLSRWHGESLSGPTLHSIAADDLGDPAADWNQAMMDLGATRCFPRNPDCARCPVCQWCVGPDSYRPPTPQGRFEGSARQLRGAIVRSLVGGEATEQEIAASAGFPAKDVEQALADLSDEGLVTVDGAGTYRIAE